jgi:hypothetical protein
MKYRKKPVEVEAVLWESDKDMHDGYEMRDSYTGQSYGFCTKEERYTTPLAKEHPLVFVPAMKMKDLKRHGI